MDALNGTIYQIYKKPFTEIRKIANWLAPLSLLFCMILGTYMIGWVWGFRFRTIVVIIKGRTEIFAAATHLSCHS